MAVYLDYNATTPVAPSVVQKITDTLNDKWGNPSSCYELGVKCKKSIEEARRHIALMIGGKPEDIIFTSGGTEVCEIHWFVKLVIESLSYYNNLYLGSFVTLEVSHFIYLPLMLYNVSIWQCQHVINLYVEQILDVSVLISNMVLKFNVIGAL